MDANDSSCFLLENILLLKIRKISQNSWKIFQQLQAKLKHGPANEIKHIMLKQQKGLVRWPCSSLLTLAGEMLIWQYIYIIKVNRLANKYYHQGTAPSATTEFVKGIPWDISLCDTVWKDRSTVKLKLKYSYIQLKTSVIFLGHSIIM